MVLERPEIYPIDGRPILKALCSDLYEKEPIGAVLRLWDITVGHPTSDYSCFRLKTMAHKTIPLYVYDEVEKGLVVVGCINNINNVMDIEFVEYFGESKVTYWFSNDTNDRGYSVEGSIEDIRAYKDKIDALISKIVAL